MSLHSNTLTREHSVAPYMSKWKSTRWPSRFCCILLVILCCKYHTTREMQTWKLLQTSVFNYLYFLCWSYSIAQIAKHLGNHMDIGHSFNSVNIVMYVCSLQPCWTWLQTCYMLQIINTSRINIKTGQHSNF